VIATRLEVPDEHIRLMYEDGLSQAQIAEAIGSTQRSVSYKLAKLGIKTRPPGPHSRSKELGW
jgi:predicted XRE-type DNA-binding protein